MSWQILVSILIICAAIYAIVKKCDARLTLFLAGAIMCLLAGSPMDAFKGFVKGMVNPNLVPPICAAMGFAAAVTYSKCDQHLVALLATPLRKIGGLLIFAGMFTTFLVNIAIMSAAGTAATVGATFIPIMIRAGIRPAGAAAAIGGGTMMGLLLNPGCAHDIYIAKLGNTPVMEFISNNAIYIVATMLVAAIVSTLVMIFFFKDNKPEAAELAEFVSEEKEGEFKINLAKATAPLVPMVLLICGTHCLPKGSLDVVASMLLGVAYIAIISFRHPNELIKSFFKGMGSGYASVIGLIIAAGVFALGMQKIGLVPAFIDLLKESNDIARWGASFGPFLLAVLTGSGEAAIWAFNQAVTPHAASFGMNPETLGLLCAIAGQLGRTASPIAGCIIIVAGIAKVSPVEISKRMCVGMLVALVFAALIMV